MSTDWHGRRSKWPEKIECHEAGCEDECDLVEDQGDGYCVYCCPTHGEFGCQFDDDDDWYDPELDFGQEFDPYEGAYEDGETDDA